MNREKMIADAARKETALEQLRLAAVRYASRDHLFDKLLQLHEKTLDILCAELLDLRMELMERKCSVDQSS